MWARAARLPMLIATGNGNGYFPHISAPKKVHKPAYANIATT
jgi:hypothetical protein